MLVASAIEKSQIVLVCFSQAYKDSANCKLEGEYCVQRRVDIIPLLMQSGYKADGWYVATYFAITNNNIGWD